MSEALQVDAPDFEAVQQESGPVLATSLQRIWYLLTETSRRLRASITIAKDRIEPRLTISATTSNADNFDTDGASVVQFTGGSAIDITGIAAPEDQKARFLILHNSGAGTKTIKNESASSTAANRIHTKTAADVALAADASMLLVYLFTTPPSTTGRWRQLF